MEDFIVKLLHLQPLASEHGGDLDRLLFYVHLLMFVLFVGWSVFFLYTVWRFRERRNPKADPVGVKSHTSTYLEGAVALIEAVLLLGFAIPLWARGASLDNFPDEKEATVIRVIGRQFNWIARYPGEDGVFGLGDPKLISASNPFGLDPEDANGADDITLETSEIVVPVNKPVIAHISSLDVIHSFSVKQMRVTQDAIPGLSIPIWFTPTKVGSYQITCAQLCGNGHFSMRGILRVLSEPDYREWLAKQSPRPAAAGGYE
ncbi:MAG: cytochrome c oxidase subunit II [Verrucomicrobiales bacterium]|nr:cytochrome c oxidase subunit II [Verrucomicrobiales bacterium]